MRITTLCVMLSILMSAFFLAPSCASVTIDSERITPVMLAVPDAPVAFVGSDGRTHLVYELWLKNFTSGKVAVEKVEVLGDGSVIATLDGAEIARRLQPAGLRETSAVMAASTQALLFIHVTWPEGQAAPKTLTHRVQVRADAAPPGMQEMSETGGEVTVDAPPAVESGPPLRGEGCVSGAPR